jgi:integrase
MAYIDGKKVKLAKGKAHRKQAEMKLRELLHFRDVNPAPESDEPTVASVIELYLAHAGRKLGERTLYERKHYLQAFAELHGWRKVKDCLPFHLTSWIDANPQWKSDWTVAGIINVVARPFNWAARQGLIPANPFRGVAHQTGQPRRPLTDEEFLALLRATSVWTKRKRYQNPSPSDVKRRVRPSAGARFRQFLVFLRYTGARPGEASRLEWNDIDLNNAVITLHEHKTSRTQRVKRPRIIPLHPVVLKLLIHIRRRNEPGNCVFLNHRKTPWNRSNLSLRVRRARDSAGIPDDAKLYGLRHSFGTRSILNGVDLKTLATLMGHTTTRMTEHYVHLVGQQAHLAAAMLRANDRHPGS